MGGAVVAELVSQAGGMKVVVIVAAGRMADADVEVIRFQRGSNVLPDRLVVVREPISPVENSDPVDPGTDVAEPGLAAGRRRRRLQGETAFGVLGGRAFRAGRPVPIALVCLRAAQAAIANIRAKENLAARTQRGLA